MIALLQTEKVQFENLTKKKKRTKFFTKQRRINFFSSERLHK